MAKLTFKTLRIWNLAVGLFMIVNAAIIFGITDYDLETPWYTVFIASREPDERAFYVPAPKFQVNVPIGLLSGIFLLLSGLDHLTTTLPGVNKWYNHELERNRNKLRWCEYALSASLMRVQIGMLSGITDIHTLFGIFCLTATTMLFGWLMESMNGDRLRHHGAFAVHHANQAADGRNGSAGYPDAGKVHVDWTPFLFGFIPHFAAWSIVACHFFRNVAKGGDTPGFVWAIIFILFILDGMFALVQFLQFKQVKLLRGFARAEFFYIILSLTSKLLLAWIEFGGAQSLKPE